MAEPLWRVIAEDLRLKTESGELGHDGAPLPTELELQGACSASQYGQVPAGEPVRDESPEPQT